MPIYPADTQLSVHDVHPRQAISGWQLSPDGGQFAFVHRRDELAEEVIAHGQRRIKVTSLADLCLLPSDGGYPRPLTSSGDFSTPAVWSPDGQWLAFARAGELQVMPATGGEGRALYRGPLFQPPLYDPGDAALGLPRWSPAGNAILFATREGHRTTLHLVSNDGRLQREILAVEGTIVSWDWSPDGRRVVVVTRGEDGWTGDVRVLDVETGAARVLCTEEHYEYRKPVAAWAPDESRIVIRSNRSGWAKLWLASPESVEQQPLTQGDWDDYAFRFSPDGAQIVYACRAEQGGSGDDLWILSLAGGTPRRLTEHDGINAPVAWSPAGRIFYWHSSPTEPGDLWSVEASGGEPRRLTWSAPLGLSGKLRAPEEVVITNDDGTNIPALIYLPARHREGQRYPAIVWVHGGPTGVSRRDFAPHNNWLANQGYVVLVPNFRGSVGYGVPHMAAVSGDGVGKHDLGDVLATGQYAKTLPYVDLARGVGIGGRSWGGYLTLMAATKAPNAFSCAVAGAAISDWRIQQAQTEVRGYDHWLVGGWVYEHPDRVHDRSPVNFAGQIAAPLLVYHGEEDHDVPYPQIVQFVEQARRAGAALDWVSYPAEGHGNRKRENRQDVLDRTARFFRRHLHPWDFRENPSGGQTQN